jgi:uncharacterized MAPEG superfamily protein
MRMMGFPGEEAQKIPRPPGEWAGLRLGCFPASPLSAKLSRTVGCPASAQEEFQMTIAFWCVLAAGLLPIVTAGIAKGGARAYDNAQPRLWMAAQEGWRARANAAQQNGWEAFPLFAAAVIIAHLTQAPAARVDLLALAFVGLRVAYIACYLWNKASLRSLVWLAGHGCIIALFASGQ